MRFCLLNYQSENKFITRATTSKLWLFFRGLLRINPLNPHCGRGQAPFTPSLFDSRSLLNPAQFELNPKQPHNLNPLTTHSLALNYLPFARLADQGAFHKTLAQTFYALAHSAKNFVKVTLKLRSNFVKAVLDSTGKKRRAGQAKQRHRLCLAQRS